MLTKFLKFMMAALAIFISSYAFRYLFGNRMFGLLQLKSQILLANVFWNIGFYSHIIPGGIALLVGWIQFSSRLRAKRVRWHRTVGKIYVVAAIVSSLAGIYISLYATGGLIPTMGFMCAALIWFYSTYKAYSSIRNKNIDTHKEMMIYSYAVCLAAVTLRFELPLFGLLFHDFIKAYLLASWLAWMPNLVVAFFIIRRQRMAALALLQPVAVRQ